MTKFLRPIKYFLFVATFFLLASFVNDKKRSPTLYMIEFNFKFNSTELVDSVDHIKGKVSSDSLFGSIKRMFLDNPQVLMIEIQGFADIKEKNPKKLSDDRANKIKNELVKKGVSETKLQTVGYGSTMPLLSEKEIATGKNLKQREQLRLKNCRATFKVTKFDEALYQKMLKEDKSDD